MTGDPVVAVAGRGPAGVTVTTRDGGPAHFDAALLCCHADDAVRLATSLDDTSRRVLSAFRYADNEAILHTDVAQMPRRRRLWSSWNYIGDAAERDGNLASHGTPMRRLIESGAIPGRNFVQVGLRSYWPGEDVWDWMAYTHPMFDTAALAAQAHLPGIQGRDALWFAGSYFGYGFHEDGVQAGLAAAEDLSAAFGDPLLRPWTWDARQSRIPVSERPPIRIAEAVN